ncbi:MAG: hypothetical protein AAGF92_09850 [Myxococcota bacterium]
MAKIRVSSGVLVASIVLHALVLFALQSERPVHPAPASSMTSVTFTVTELEPEVRTAHLPDETSTQVTSSRRWVPVPPKSAARAGRSGTEEGRDAEETTLREEPPMPLDPRSVARALVVSQQQAQQSVGEANDQAGGVPNRLDGVGHKNYLSAREPPPLLPREDGTYRYRANTFEAVVAEDGSVTFTDANQQSATISFDITDHMMRKRGEDPYRVEKQWFLEDTSEFRRALFERWRAKHMTLALRTLRTRLLRLSEDAKLSDQQKAERVIAIYRDTASDDAGAAARDIIATFVSDRMPGVSLPDEPR